MFTRNSYSNWKILVMTCPDLAQIKFGSVEVTGNHVNDTATFKSNSGYNLVGPETITCKVINSTASWSHASPMIKGKALFSIYKNN